MKQNIALVLSSGGARGIAHIGVIEELLDSGYNITSISGTSMGALVGAMQAKGTLPEFKEWLLSVTKMDMLKFMDLAVGHGGLIKGEKIMKVVGEYIGDMNIENLPIPFSCVAADLEGHREVVFDAGNLLLAIRASCSIPTVFLPVYH
ncbi:MAG TPA: patatin-like phospholipase family protein, partial [Bacteroidales bacterium]|nr:patatin-like phospholipase family protein [Bacteroidales bacterium]